MEIYSNIPAMYTETDPYDVTRLKGLVNELKTDWFMESPERQREAIGNSFRAALTSPQQDLKWNSIVYQDLQDIPHDINDPDVYENHIRSKKSLWDSFGQTALDTLGTVADPKTYQMYAPHMVQKYLPGMWKNIRNTAAIPAKLDQLRQIALEDVSRGADGNYFRHQVLQLQIPGVGPKIASFAWLLLNPDKSKLSTLDVHMMRALKQDFESPPTLGDYHHLEKQLDEHKNSLGYHDVPLGMFQWAVWDHQRAHGFHQDHSPLRPLDPKPWHQVEWSHSTRQRSRKPPEAPAGQEPLFAKVKLAWTI
jgi:hypothetical protein